MTIPGMVVRPAWRRIVVRELIADGVLIADRSFEYDNAFMAITGVRFA